MGKKKHKKNKKNNKKQTHASSIASRRIPSESLLPNYFWGLSNFLEPWNTPFLDRIPVTKPLPDPLTDKDVDAAAQAADQIVRKHKK